jgi:hypothetical protein
MSDYLCHDFKTPLAGASRRLPSSFRFVPIAFYFAIVGGIYFVTMDIMSLRRAAQERVTFEQLRKEREETKAKLVEEKLMVDIEMAKARDVAGWVEGTRVLQPICVEVARAIQAQVKIAEFVLDRNPQLPSQIDVSMRLTGADASQIAAVENAFGKLNYRPYSPQQARTQEMIDYRSTLVFGNE